MSRPCGPPDAWSNGRGAYRVYECFIDGTFAKARGGGDGIGRGHLGKGVKIMVLVDARGLPVAIDTAPADAHESRCVQRCSTSC
ncbi:MAG: hypothetical protein IPM18_09305 [Phycisphaerales bacterium]|nr:hypothetical protein [Phycisphaerales bacterium]